MQISIEEGQLLSFLIQSIGATHYLESGVLPVIAASVLLSHYRIMEKSSRAI